MTKKCEKISYQPSKKSLKRKMDYLFGDTSDLDDQLILKKTEPNTRNTKTPFLDKEIKIKQSFCNKPHSSTEYYQKKQEIKKRIEPRKKTSRYIHPVRKIERYINKPDSPPMSNTPKLKNIQKLFRYQQRLVIAIEGNIGSGKTTMLQQLNKLFPKDQPNILTLREPLEQWTNVNKKNLLEMMYNDPSTWVTPFQSFALVTLAKNYLKTHGQNVSILERSIQSTRYCFIEMHKEANRIDETNGQILHEWFTFLETMMHIEIDLTIYIKTTPDVIFKRIHERNRKGEEKITLEYLKKLDQYHENWLTLGKFKKPLNIVVINGNNNTQAMIHELNEKLGNFFDNRSSY